jgi:DNA-binding MarR family transcriptional regulator
MAVRRVSIAEFRALATFRYELRRFVRFSEDAARRVELEPRQHQLLLAVRGMPDGIAATVGALAERLQLRHHSTVELIDRSEARRLVRRAAPEGDRRRVVIELTPRGERVLGRLAAAHRAELRTVAGRLIAALDAAVGDGARVRGEGRRGRAA